MNAFFEGARRSFVTRRVAASATASVGAAVLNSVCAVAVAQQATPHNFDQITVTAERITPTAPGEGAARAEASRVPGGADVVSTDDYADGRAAP